MADPVSLASLFDAAEQAAMGGDFAVASRLLGDAARAQEAALGPHHLDLANTLNNLAVAHERCGQLDEAEREYRRAHAIAARALPADDPLVTTSAQNLREFCEANGRSMDAPAAAAAPAASIGDAVTVRMAAPAFDAPVDPPTEPIEPLALTFGSDAEAKSPRSLPAAAGADVRRPATSSPTPAGEFAEPLAIRAAHPPASTPPAAPATPPARPPAPVRPTATVAPGASPAAAPAAPAAAGRRLSIPVLVALGAVAVLVIWLLAGRGPAAPPAEPQAAAPELPAAAPPAAPASPSPSAPAARSAARPAPGPASAPAAAAADGSISVGDAQLCTALSAGYRCTAAGDAVRPGPLVFYTRLIATRDTTVVHRWYRGNELRQSIRLDVPARRQGFRTFSRGTVSAAEGEWRVELRTRDGQLLHAVRFAVR